MVLDEASPTAPDSFATTDGPQNDFDSFSSASPDTPPRSSTAKIPDSIDFTQLPRSMPIAGPLLGYTETHLRSLIEFDARTMSAVMQRPLTLPEWEASAFHMAKLESYASYGWPLGMAWGAYRAQRTMHEWRFPMYKPNLEKIGRERFDRFLSLRGEMARGAWHSMRFGLYMGAFGALSKLVITFFGLNVALMGQRVDTRLKNFWDTLRSLDQEEIRARRLHGASLPSFNASAEDQENLDVAADVEAMDDSTERRQPSRPTDDQSVWGRRRAAAAKGELPTPASPPSSAANAPQETSSSFEFDDASPQAKGDPQPQPKVGSQETAWDRLRRGNGAQPATSPPQQTRPLQGAQGDAWANLRRGAEDETSSEDNMR
ncbi:MAG: hypothetical protein Q9162_004558 [Coniocarpon cinnabarinum]